MNSLRLRNGLGVAFLGWAVPYRHADKAQGRVWGPRQTKRVGRTSIKPKRAGRTSINPPPQPPAGWADQYQTPSGLGGPVLKKKRTPVHSLCTRSGPRGIAPLLHLAPLLHPSCTPFAPPPFCSILYVLVCFVLDRLFTIVHDALPFCSILHVKACCTAPSLNPNMNPQKNKASPKRPQFFLPGLLKVALLPGHWCAWNRRCVDPQ